MTTHQCARQAAQCASHSPSSRLDQITELLLRAPEPPPETLRAERIDLAEDPKQIGKVKARLLRKELPGSRVLHQLHKQIGGKGLQDVALGLGLEANHDEKKWDESII